jgi:hypothetical protein
MSASAPTRRNLLRGEPGASEIMANLFDPDYLMEHELVFIGSPETVAKKIHSAPQSGLSNTFMGEFNFSDLPERPHALDPPIWREGNSGAARVRTVLMPRCAPSQVAPLNPQKVSEISAPGEFTLGAVPAHKDWARRQKRSEVGRARVLVALS